MVHFHIAIDITEDGAIFVSIDDNEVHNIRLLLDEVFGTRNHVATLTWQKRVSPANDAKYFSSDHEYVVVYASRKDAWRPNRLKRTPEQLRNYRNPDDDPRGPWNSVTYTCNKTAEERPNLYHGILNPSTSEVIWPRRTAVWKYDVTTHEEHVRQDLIYWGRDGRARMPRLKQFLSGTRDVVPRSVLLYADYGHTQEARTELLRLIPNVPFTTPKPVRLIRRILEIATDSNSLILDSFAGSGTTGHATLALNAADGGRRRFILVEMEPAVCRTVTAERLDRVVQGRDGSDRLGGGAKYCILGESLFDETGLIRPTVSFRDLAAHVYFTETGTPIPKPATGRTPLLGAHSGNAVYLLFNGVLGDKRPDGGNVLTGGVVRRLPKPPGQVGQRIIYGEGCRLGAARLKREGIVFKQIPYEIKVS